MRTLWTAVLVVFCVTGAASAASPDPQQAGRWFGIIQSCKCVRAERDAWLAYLRERLSAAYGEAYFKTIKGYIELGLDEIGYDNRSAICSSACTSEHVAKLQKEFDVWSKRGQSTAIAAFPAPRQTSADVQSRPIAVQWDGVNKLIAGTLNYRQASDGSGEITAELPDSQGTCRGRYQLDRTGKAGTWSVSCTNGLAASGTLVTHGPNAGSSGEGIDALGRAVRVTVGAKNN